MIVALTMMNQEELNSLPGFAMLQNGEVERKVTQWVVLSTSMIKARLSETNLHILCIPIVYHSTLVSVIINDN